MRFSKYKNTHQFEPGNVPWSKGVQLATSETDSLENTTCITAGTSTGGLHNGEEYESLRCQIYKRKEVNLMKPQIKEYRNSSFRK